MFFLPITKNETVENSEYALAELWEAGCGTRVHHLYSSTHRLRWHWPWANYVGLSAFHCLIGKGSTYHFWLSLGMAQETVNCKHNINTVGKFKGRAVQTGVVFPGHFSCLLSEDFFPYVCSSSYLLGVYYGIGTKLHSGEIFWWTQHTGSRPSWSL